MELMDCSLADEIERNGLLSNREIYSIAMDIGTVPPLTIYLQNCLVYPLLTN